MPAGVSMSRSQSRSDAYRTVCPDGKNLSSSVSAPENDPVLYTELLRDRQQGTALAAIGDAHTVLNAVTGVHHNAFTFDQAIKHLSVKVAAATDRNVPQFRSAA